MEKNALKKTDKKYRYFFMDLDGTLSDSSKGITKAVAYALHKMGIVENDLNSLKKFIGPPLVDSFAEFYDLSEEDTKQAILYFKEYYSVTGMYENELYPGMKHLLDSVNEHGGTVVVATSKPEDIAKTIIEYFKITNQFQLICGSAGEFSRNRKDQVIAYALQELKLTPDQAIMIGDRKHDILGADKNQMESVGVLFGFGDRKELEAAGADYIAESVTDLEQLMISMIG